MNPEDIKEDWDFDFGIYDADEKDEEQDTTKSIFTKRSRFNDIRSRFTNSGMLFSNMTILERDLIKAGTKVSKYSQDINDLWDFFAIINEYWENIISVYPQITLNEVSQLRNKCLQLLKEYKDSNIIPEKVHNYLLFFRRKILDLAQFKNFRFECEKYGTRSYQSRIRS